MAFWNRALLLGILALIAVVFAGVNSGCGGGSGGGGGNAPPSAISISPARQFTATHRNRFGKPRS